MRNRGDWIGIAACVATTGAMIAYRAWGVEPGFWVAACTSADPPLACIPRAALGFAQYWSLWGLAALTAGTSAFALASRPLGMLAVALGAMAVINWNASWGMLGLALGAWAWLDPARRGRPARQTAGPTG